jgi:hypothetical protein
VVPGRVEQRFDRDGAISVDQQHREHRSLFGRPQGQVDSVGTYLQRTQYPELQSAVSHRASRPFRSATRREVSQEVIVMPNRRKGWLIAGIAALAAVALVIGVVVGLRLSHQAPPQATLSDDFAQLETRLNVTAGIAVSAVGSDQGRITLGDWQTGPAWSTIKVPLVIAALREQTPPRVTDAMVAAITESSNEAAESIWAGLGDPLTAAGKVEAVLRQSGDPTTVQSQKVRPQFSAFGQTDWPLAEQVRFLSAAVCDNANAPIFRLMGEVQADQRWGLGAVSGSQFKGGWGPSPTGGYLVRQMGVLTTSRGRIAVALAAQPASGTFDDGVSALTQMATWLTSHVSALPTGRCAASP